MEVSSILAPVNINNSILNNVGRDQYNIYVSGHELRDIGAWLSPLNFKLDQSEIYHSREVDTGKWLLDSEEFKDWRDGEPGTLWCPGIPGAGKTVIASIIINHLQRIQAQDGNVAIVYIYCHYKEQTLQTLFNLIASLLKQLVQDYPAAYNRIKLLYNHHEDRGTLVTLEEIRQTLQSEIKMFAKVFIIVDALDECSEAGGARGKLLNELRSLADTVRLLVTSRDLPSISQYFRGTKRLDIHADDQDVRDYIESRIRQESELAALVEGHPTLQEEIVKGIIENARGMFLLAKLHLNSLTSTNNPRDARTVLGNLPNEVNHAYDQTMRRIEGQVKANKDLAEQVLCWITYACRPLSVGELRHAVAISPGMREMDPDALVHETMLTSVCAGLVVVDKESSIVRLVHYTTQLYFEDTRESRFPDAQARITAMCLTYLSFDIFQRGYCQSEELEQLLADNVFFGYAARHWGHHARGRVEETSNCKSVALKFLLDGPKVACASQVLLRDEDKAFPMPKDFFGMHTSSFYGLAKITNHQLEYGAKAGLRDSNGRTPLSYASKYGHEAVVRLLLEQNDTDVNSKDWRDRTPLSFAAERGHEAVVQLLLERDDIDVDMKDSNGRTPLSFAAKCGHEAVVKLLLQWGKINVKLKDFNWKTLPTFAYKAAVTALFKRENINVNSKDQWGRTPLLYAAECGCEAVIKLLFMRDDIDADPKDSHGRTPLSFAASNGHGAVVKLLLERDHIDVNSKDSNYRTALSFAAQRGHEAVVKLLLKRDDIIVNSKDSCGRTPLSFAARWGRKEVVRLLLEQDNIDANSKDTSGRTPLLLATIGGRNHLTILSTLGFTNDSKELTEVVKLLLERHDVDVNLKDPKGRTALSFAAERGHVPMVKLLLEQDNIDTDSKDSGGRTPLSFAASSGRNMVVKLLLERDDIDVDSKDSNDRTPLSFASQRKRKAVVKLLLKQDNVNTDLKDSNGGTPLLFAAEHGLDMGVRR